MRVMTLTGIRQMEMREVAEPAIAGDTDVVIGMKAIGVCGSDVHYYATGRIGSQVVEYPFPVGHESAGVVEAVGPGVTRVKVGDRVAIEPAMPCGACDQCRAGRPHTCRNLKFLGCPGQANGCMSDRIVMPESSCYPIPDTMTFDQAALSEPLSIGVYAVELAKELLGDLAGKTVGILGVGPIGLSVMLPALSEGAGAVYVTDKIDARLALAAGAGATWTGNVDTQDVVAEISAAEEMLLDVVFECCGQQDAIDQAQQILKPGGKLLIVGIPEADRISFVPDWCRRKELCFQNVRRQNHCVQPALDLIAEGKIDVDFMVTHRFSLAQSKEAFDLVDQYADGVVKAMIEL